LDLSGNDFKTLPNTLKGLSKLEVLYLNDEKEFDLKQNMDIISNLTSLRELHLENNNLKALPNKIEKLKNLELLYLNNNKFIEFPKQVMSLEHLQYLDLKDNNINPNIPELNNVNFGFKINLK
jgi:Leucine-rich repeat (LRR) protein